MNDRDPARAAQLPVVQPDPTLREHHVGPMRMAITALACLAIVLAVLFSLTRPVEQPQMAATETTETAPAGGGAANNAGAQNTAARRPTTTGQGQQQGGPSSGPPAAGGAATGTAGGPNAKPAPETR
jgi:hypothetical protein